MSNIDALADSVSQQIKGYIAERFKSMEATLREFVRGAIDGLPKPKDGEHGKDADPAAVEAAVRRAVEAIPRPRDGTSVDRAEVESMVRAAVDAIPRPKDGASVDPAAVAAQIVEAAASAVRA